MHIALSGEGIPSLKTVKAINPFRPLIGPVGEYCGKHGEWLDVAREPERPCVDRIETELFKQRVHSGLALIVVAAEKHVGPR
jgi:hypothetical protein